MHYIVKALVAVSQTC